jgi:tripartite-type tricarboxylate transporter receptor subunit TctC
MRNERRLERRRGRRSGNLTILFIVSIFLSSFALLPLAAALAAEEWPTRTITVINGSAVGGLADVIARPFAHEMSKVLGVPIVVTSITGGGGGIAAQNVFQAPNDGYTWQAQGAQIRVMGVMGYHTSGPKDWYVLPLVGYLAAFVVREDSPYKTFPDLLEALKKNPDKTPFIHSVSINCA